MPERRRTRAQERADDIDISPTALTAQIEVLTGERDEARQTADEARQTADEARQTADEFLGALQRERAEFQNFKKRTAEERMRDLGLAGEVLIGKVLAVADDFDRAIEARPASIADDPWFDGIAAIDRKLRLLLESEGVTSIDASPGRPFDPREHEAIKNVPDPERREGEIVEEIRRGYRLRDRVIRPALVAVATNTNDTPS
jgi:molecular chaperone GrpE